MPRFAGKLLLAEEVCAAARCLHVVVRAERGVPTREDALRGRHVAGLAGGADGLVAATEGESQDSRGVGAGLAGGHTEAGVRAGGQAGLPSLAPRCGATLTSLRGADCSVTAPQTDLTESLTKKNII